MGIVIINQTICPICGKKIKDRDSIMSIPAFVLNINDPLYFFSDNSFHESCLQKHPLGKTVVEYSNLFIKHTRPSSRICIISKKLITNPLNHIFIEFLTSDKNDFLEQFNFAHIDKDYLPRWDIRSKFISELKNLVLTRNWKEQFNRNVYLDRTIKELT
ncbi:MAG: hypothetical protein U0T79_03905 [Ferruginibacter sp.]